MSIHRHRRAGLGLVLSAAVLATVAGVAPVSAASNGAVSVSGGSVTTIELTIPDDTAAFGTNLTPDGATSDSTDTVTANVDGSPTSAGTCYEWSGTARVRSNKNYYLLVTSAAANSKLGFLKTDPADYAACVAGEAASTTMYALATPAGSWTTSQTRTAKRVTDFWLGLQVLWTDDPSGTVGSASMTISTSVAP